jgi:hypothetical protein
MTTLTTINLPLFELPLVQLQGFEAGRCNLLKCYIVDSIATTQFKLNTKILPSFDWKTFLVALDKLEALENFQVFKITTPSFSEETLVSILEKARYLKELEITAEISCPQLFQTLGQCCPYLEKINLSGYKKRLKDDDLFVLMNGGRPLLKSLTLSDCALLSDETVEVLKNFSPNIEYLNLDNCSQVTVKAVKGLIEKCPYLSTLYLGGLSFDEEEKEIGQFQALKMQKISIYQCKINEEQLQNFVKVFPNLKYLNIGGLKNISYKILEGLLAFLSKLEILSLYNISLQQKEIEDLENRHQNVKILHIYSTALRI